MSSFIVLPTDIWDIIVSYLEWLDQKHILCDDCYPLNIQIFSSDICLLSFCKRYFFIESLNILSSISSLSIPFKIYIISNLISTLYPEYKCYHLSRYFFSNDKQVKLLVTAICFRHLIDIFVSANNFNTDLNENNCQHNTMWQYFHKHEYFRIFFTKIILSRPYSVLYALEHIDHELLKDSSERRFYTHMKVCSTLNLPQNEYRDLFYDMNETGLHVFRSFWSIGNLSNDRFHGYGFCIFSGDANYHSFFYAQPGNDDRHNTNYWLQSTGDQFIKYNKDTSLNEFIKWFDSNNIKVKYWDNPQYPYMDYILHFPNYYYVNKLGIKGVKCVIKHWLNAKIIGNNITDVIIEYYWFEGWNYCGGNLPHMHCFECYYPLVEAINCGCQHCYGPSACRRRLSSRYPEVNGIAFTKIFTKQHQLRDTLFLKFQRKIAKSVTDILEYIENKKIYNVCKCMELMDTMRIDVNNGKNMRRSKVLKQSIERCIRRIINSMLPLKYVKSIQPKTYDRYAERYPIEYRYMNKKDDISISNGRPCLWPPLYLMVAISYIKVIAKCLKFDLLSIKIPHEKREKISIKKLNKKQIQKMCLEFISLPNYSTYG